jgi:archaellum biogenesis ATPase FlaH
MALNFQIKKFNVDMLKDRCEIDSRKSPMIVIIGKKDTGKSFLVRDILYNTQHAFPIGTVISGTEVANEFFQHMVPSKLIHDKYQPSIVTNVINFMPYNLLIVVESQGFVLIPAIMVIKQKYLYLQYVFSCRRLPTMRISALTYLIVIVIGFISSFYYITSSFIVAVFLGHIYQIHSKIILQMNTDCLKKSIWLLE